MRLAAIRVLSVRADKRKSAAAGEDVVIDLIQSPDQMRATLDEIRARVTDATWCAWIDSIPREDNHQAAARAAAFDRLRARHA